MISAAISCTVQHPFYRAAPDVDFVKHFVGVRATEHLHNQIPVRLTVRTISDSHGIGAYAQVSTCPRVIRREN